MTDPLHVLRAPVTPADPDPGFAIRLRARLARAFGLPEGVQMSGTAAAAPAPSASPRPGDVGYASLWVPDTERAAAFYAAVLGWEYSPGHDPRGRQVPGSVPPQGLWGGHTGSTLFCSYVVDDAAAAAARVRAAGGQAGEPVRQPYGLSVDCVDDQGTRFAVHEPPERAPAGGRAAAASRDGDLAYITLEVPDGARARDFYQAVLGWRIEPGRVTDGWQVTSASPLIGISGGHPRPVAVPLWRVADVTAAVDRVRAAGGTAHEPAHEPYGLVAECTDDQGTRFTLAQFPARE